MPIEANNTVPIPKNVAQRDMLIIAAVWLVSVFIVNPVGDFPLNDDWSYGLVVKRFLETGSFHPNDWGAMTLVTNAAWGSLFCLPDGFSFTALRLSTLTLSLIGILGVYVLVRDLHQPRWFAVVAAVTLGANPIYYAVSNTFMTDVPFAAILIVAAVFLARSLRSGSNFDLTVGTAFAVAGTLSRQLALAVPLAFAVSLILARGFTKDTVLRAVTPAVVCLSILVVVQAWLAKGGHLSSQALFIGKDSPYLSLNSMQRILDDPAAQIVARVGHRIISVTKNTYVGVLYLGFFLLPVLIFAAPEIVRLRGRGILAFLAVAITTLALTTGVVALVGVSPAVPRADQYPVAHLMPLSGNVLMASGIGPLMLRDNWIGNSYVPVLPAAPALPAGFWVLVTLMSVLGAAFLISILCVRLVKLVPLFGRERTEEVDVVGTFYLLCAMVYLLAIFIFGLIDRYLVPPIPFLIGAVAGMRGYLPQFVDARSKSARYVAAALLAAFSIFAIASTRDYLGWNRVRWNALNELMNEHHVGPDNIDGGFEFNAMYLYDPQYQYDPRKSWWWVQGDKYRIAFGEMPGYRVIKEYRYQHWLPPYAGRVVVLQEDR
jgi:hypothetical protein